VPLVQSSPGETPAQRLWQNQQNEITKADPWKNPDQLITRDRDGVVSASPRADPAAQPQPPVGDASVENGHLKVGDLTLSPDEVKGLLERHSLEQSRKALMPATADGYQLPTDMKLPPGVEFKWSVDNEVLGPALTQAKQIAFDAGLSNEQFGRLMSVYASAQIHEQQQFARAQAAEVQKLGDLANVRLDSLRTWVSSQIGTEGAKALTETMFTARQVQAFEKLMHKFVSGGSGSFSGAHREPSHPNKLSDESYSKLGYLEKIRYAEQWPQNR
jgi:hypothetical protein